eukprot:scaffold10179_cov270-Chaetoceros_neogracile.AAC.15
MDDSVANAVKCLIPSFRTIWLPTIFAIMLMIPNMATNEEKSFGAKFHSVFARIWKTSPMKPGKDCNMRIIANISARVKTLMK